MGEVRMNKLKYPEKRYLSTYELTSSFFDEMRVKVFDIVPLRKVFILKTSNGNKILKRIDYGEDKLNFINYCLKAVDKIGKNILSFNTFKNGKSYIDWKGKRYVLMDLIDGREVSFTNPLEFTACCSFLANLHLASKENTNNDFYSKMDRNLILKFKDNLHNIKDEKKLVEKYKYKNEFDELFYVHTDEYIEEMDKAIKMLWSSQYCNYRNNHKNVVVCHNDLAEHNFLYKDNEIYLIDFDYCSIDLRILDLADIILKGIKNAGFDFDKAVEGIESYNSIYPLEDDEYKLLYILLLFPRDFCNIVNSYYFKQKNWEQEVFISRLKAKLNNESFRREFLEKFKEKYLKN